jgi:biopolymer transport protein ExbD
MSWLRSYQSKQARFTLGAASANSSHIEPEINLIPFIDVLLVVLIFLMISTTFTRYQELAITLPTASGVESQNDSKQIHIAVSRDGRFAVNGKVTDRSQLSNSLSQFTQNSTNKECSKHSSKHRCRCKSPASSSNERPRGRARRQPL